jgi:uncharacterized membrane protein
MWMRLAYVFMGGLAVTLLATEILRSAVHKRRERTRGIGGTQDIAMWGSLIGLIFCVAAITCFVVAASRGRS